MKERKTPIRKIAALVLAVVCAIAVIYVGTTAWLTGAPLNPVRLMNLEDFEVTADIYFHNGSVRTEITSFVQADGSILVNPTNSAAANYVGNLRVDVATAGRGANFVRVKLTHQWLFTPNSGTPYRLQSEAALPFSFGANWFDNRNSDYSLYYNRVPSAGTKNVVTGFNASMFDPTAIINLASGGTVSLTVGVEVEAVQFNRYKQIWGLTALPWRA